MYNYKIKNPEQLAQEIDGLNSFPLLKNKIKEKLFSRIIEDAKENCECLTPEKLFDEQDYGVWFRTGNYSEFSGRFSRYDTFVIYQCRMNDNREAVEIILK